MAILAFLPEIVAFLMFMLMSTQLSDSGPILVLIEIAMMGVLFLIRPLAFAETAIRWWPLLLTPILAMISAIWSDAAVATLRYGLQYLFTAFVGVHLARLLSPRQFVSVLFASLFVFCLLCIVHGRQGESAEGPVLIGLTGSKNQMGFAAQLLMLSALATLMLGVKSAPLKWMALLALPLSLYLVVGVHSATALLMALGGAVALAALCFAVRMTPGARLATLLGLCIIIAPLLLLLPEINAWMNNFVFDTLGKDPTLTGRTLLWARADELIAQRPILGYGYQAIWMGDSTETVALQRLTGVTDGRLFHFHHQFRQVAVDTGYVGLVVFVAMFAGSILASLRQALMKPEPATAFFFVLLALTLARAFTDTLLHPFSVHTILFYAACVYAFAPERNTERVGFLSAEPRRAPEAPMERRGLSGLLRGR